MVQNSPFFAPSGTEYSIQTGNFHISFLRPGWESPGPEDPSRFELYPHLIELNLCLRGKGRIELNSAEHAVEPGSVWFSDRQSNIFWHEIKRQELSFLRISILIQPLHELHSTEQDRLLGEFLQSFRTAGPGFSPIGYDPSLCEYSDFLRHRVSAGSPCGFECILLGLLMDTLHALNHSESPSTEVQRIEAYVKANALQKISVGDLAKLLSVSERSLFYIFSKYFHTSPNDYINRARMDFAAEHLRSGCTIREVSELFKFSETASFCRMFKKYYGCTPTEFKRHLSSPGQTADRM